MQKPTFSNRNRNKDYLSIYLLQNITIFMGINCFYISCKESRYFVLICLKARVQR